MSNDKALIKTLFEKYANGSASPEEIKQLFSLISDKQYDEEMKSLLSGELQETDLQDNYDTERWGKVFDKIKAETELMEFEEKPVRYIGFRRLAIAASVAACLGIGFYFYQQQSKPVQNNLVAKNDIAPGTNHALLKIGHGRTIVLDSSRNGLIAQQGNTVINKTDAGQLAYSQAGKAVENETAMVYDTLVNPAGAKVYHLTLADGTRLAINAATTLRFPENFKGKERRIGLLNGELYGEVVHNDAMPFRVMAGDVLVEDVGTHFNINAYKDEPNKKITLLEGSVKVWVKSSSALLRPGQQASVIPNSTVIKVENVDTEQAVAWTTGNFMFDGEDLGTVMRKISRWYDVDVVFENPEQKKEMIGGGITMFTNVSKVLGALEKVGHVHFKVNGRKITVMK